MYSMNITLLNSTQSEQKGQRQGVYTASNTLDPLNNITIFIRTGEFMLEKFEVIERYTTQFSAEEDIEKKSELRHLIAQPVEKCLQIVHEFKMGFSVPNDHPDRKEFEFFLYRFLQLEEQIQLYHIGFRLPCLQQAKEIIIGLTKDFRAIKSKMQAILDGTPVSPSHTDSAESTECNIKVSA